jgi:hypothetical protein
MTALPHHYTSVNESDAKLGRFEVPPRLAQAPGRFGRRALHLGGLALYGSTPRLGEPYAGAAAARKRFFFFIPLFGDIYATLRH